MRAEAQRSRFEVRTHIEIGREGVDQGGASFTVVRRDWAEVAVFELVEALMRAESVEQVVGFYLVDTDDEARLRDACERFASRGEHIELRRLAE